jgi:hypothetical protein
MASACYWAQWAAQPTLLCCPTVLYCPTYPQTLKLGVVQQGGAHSGAKRIAGGSTDLAASIRLVAEEAGCAILQYVECTDGDAGMI